MVHIKETVCWFNQYLESCVQLRSDIIDWSAGLQEVELGQVAESFLLTSFDQQLQQYKYKYKNKYKYKHK